MGRSWWARLTRGTGSGGTGREMLSATDVHGVLHGALHDPLTGLPEQALLLDRLEQAMARSRRIEGGVAIFVVHVEDAAAITSRYGRSVLDKVLVEMAGRLSRTLRESDTAARYGESDFAVLCDGLRSQEDVAIVAGRLASALDPPYDVRHGTLAIRVMLHLVLPEPAATALTLLDEIDETLRESAG